MAQPTFPFLSNFGPASTAVQPSYFSGLSIAPENAAVGGNSVGPNGTPIETGTAVSVSPQFQRWGEGLPVSPIFTYDITPFGAFIDGNAVNLTSGDICSFPSGTTNGTYATFTPSGAGPNLNTTWLIPNAANYFQSQGYGYNPANPNIQLRLDWPRALGITLSATLTNLSSYINVYGYDFYGNPMTATFGNQPGGSQGNGEIKNVSTVVSGATTCYQYAPTSTTLYGGGFAGPLFPNKAFYIISGVAYFGSDTTGNVNVVTTRQMGLPYYYNPLTCLLLGLNYNGQTELTGCSASTGYAQGLPIGLVNGDQSPTGSFIQQAFFGVGAKNTTPVAGGLDVRGTYSPSVTPSGNGGSLMISYYSRGGNNLLKMYAESCLPQGDVPQTTSGYTVIPPSFYDIYGTPQYVAP